METVALPSLISPLLQLVSPTTRAVAAQSAPCVAVALASPAGVRVELSSIIDLESS
jgi:hypothetical protein